MSGKLIVVDVDGTVNPLVWPEKNRPELRLLQQIVEGYIEPVQVRYEGRVREAYVNEEGIPKGLPHNFLATSMLTERYFGNTIFGKMVIWVPDPKPKKDKV
jgi:hypothetical protein